MHMDVPHFDLEFDFMNPSNSYANGFEGRDTEYFFQAKGKVGVRSILGLPFSIGVGVTLPMLDKEYTAKVINTPAIMAEATYEVLGIASDDLPASIESDTCSERRVKESKTPSRLNGCLTLGADDQAVRNFTEEDFSDSSMTSATRQQANKTGVVLVDSSSMATGKQLFISIRVDGNIYLQRVLDAATRFQTASSAFSKWARQDDVTTGLWTSTNADITLATDDADRALFLFPDILERLGVFRVRVLEYDRIPTGAAQTVLAPIDLDDRDETGDKDVAKDLCSDVDAEGRRTNERRPDDQYNWW
ncbi:Hypothetical protein D9617_15g041680 [Elsinoe fawcettii]|nr:Hypothetical protein D9617_15g041680 [Elsinoe fawcettii]